MHSYFSQQQSQQHMDDLRHEVEIAQATDRINKAEISNKQRRNNPNFLQNLYGRIGFLYKQPATQQTTRQDEVSLEEIKPAVLTTFSVMREGGLVSEYDDQFIEKFVQTLEHELAQQARCHSI